MKTKKDKLKFLKDCSFEIPGQPFKYYVLDEEKKEMICLVLKSGNRCEEIPSKVEYVSLINDNLARLSHKPTSGTYTVVEVYFDYFVRRDDVCFKIPETIRDVYIYSYSCKDDHYDHSYNFSDHNSSLNTKFEVSESNPYLKSVEGSLYSKDMSELIHLYIPSKTERVEITSSVSKIREGAMCGWQGKDCTLLLPDTFTNITERFACQFEGEMIFKGKVKSIANGAFDLYDMPSKLCINNQMENISLSEEIVNRYGHQNGLRGWFDMRTNPIAQYTEEGESYIQLSLVLHNDNATLIHKDTLPLLISINPESAKSLVCEESSERISIMSDSNLMIFACPRYLKNTYEPRMGTKIRIVSPFAGPEGMEYDVYEDYSVVKDMILNLIGKL